MPTRSGLGDPDATAIIWFLGFVAITLGITWWAARRTRTANDFFAAGGSVSAAQGAPSVALVQRVAGYALGGFESLRIHDAVVGISYRPVDSAVMRAAITRGARIVEVRMSPQRLSELPKVVRDGELAWAMLGNVEDRWTTN